MDMHDWIRVCVISIMEYLKEHPEAKEEVDPEIILEKFFKNGKDKERMD